MAETTKIQWTDHTFNPWRGCTKVHTGCAHCYAEQSSGRNPRILGTWGPNGTRVVAAESYWREPLKWNKAAEAAGKRRRVFCASLADVFEDWKGSIQNHRGDLLYCDGDGNLTTDGRVPEYPHQWGLATLDDVRRRLFNLIVSTPWLDWLLLTKRPENVHRCWPRWRTVASTEPQSIGEVTIARLPNAWIGTSVSDQETADKAVPELLKLRDLSPVLFLSVEPLIGPVSLQHADRWIDHLPPAFHFHWLDQPYGVDWVIVGGESGPNARPCNVAWIRSIVKQCDEAEVPCFVKQLGANVVDRNDAGFEGDDVDAWPMDTDTIDLEQGWQGQAVRVRLRDPKGGDPTEWPEDLRVRELPIAEEVRA